MIKLDSNYLKNHKTPTACGNVPNYSLSDNNVINFIDKYFGGFIFVDNQKNPFEVRCFIKNKMTKSDFDIYKNDNDYLQEIEYDYSIDENNDIFIGFVFSILVENAGGSLRYEEDYLDEENRLFFESE